jgi:hypothetical protein
MSETAGHAVRGLFVCMGISVALPRRRVRRRGRSRMHLTCIRAADAVHGCTNFAIAQGRARAIAAATEGRAGDYSYSTAAPGTVGK